MKIAKILIKNFGPCEEIRLDCGSVHALVGANNAGKSTILRALDFFFNPSSSKITEETFWNHDLTRQIWVEILFTDLQAREKEQLGPYLRPDGSFQMARSARRDASGETPDEAKVTISPHYCVPMPEPEWLRESMISGAKIKEWWPQRDSLVVGDHSFGATLGTSAPSVAVWKAKAAEFVSGYLGPADMTDSWADNPQGYANVLKGTLPHFILVPAVRDLSDEAKASKTNPFGRLLYRIVESVTADQRAQLNEVLSGLRRRLNRDGRDDRLEGIVRTESRLNEILREYMQCDLEIEFQPPTLEVLLTTPRLYANDGFRNIAENKGHGLQRAIIFSILQCYAETVTGIGDSRTRGLIFAVEEPETYMHPQAQRTIRRVFLALATAGDQVLFSTHSALMLDIARFDEIVRVEAVPGELAGGKVIRTRVWQLAMDDLLTDLRNRHPAVAASPDSIRELYMNAYHPTRSEGCFAHTVLLVEGPTEHYALPIYAEALGYQLDGRNIAVVDCGGKGSMDRLYRVFNELGISCFMLFDYDKDSDKAENLAKSRELLELVGESSAPPTDLFVSENVACFPKKWEQTFQAEVADLGALHAEARSSMGLSDDSGKPLVARYVARKLTQRDPVFVPLSIKSILDAVVAAKWKRSCLRRSADSSATGATMDRPRARREFGDAAPTAET